MIRIAETKDIEQIMEVAEAARAFLKACGSTQWQNGYPEPNDFLSDIEKKYLFVYEEAGKILGIVALVREKDENYDAIFSGDWLNDEPYYSVHRLAVLVRGKGIARKLLEHVEKVAIENGIRNLKADTAEKNLIMQHLFSSLGYHKCGVIYLKRTPVDNERIAYQKILQHVT